MDRLMQMPFFKMVSQEQVVSLNDKNKLDESYKEFSLAIIDLVKPHTRMCETPVFFILTYTRLELLQVHRKGGEACDKKKCACPILSRKIRYAYRKYAGMVCKDPFV